MGTLPNELAFESIATAQLVIGIGWRNCNGTCHAVVAYSCVSAGIARPHSVHLQQVPMIATTLHTQTYASGLQSVMHASSAPTEIWAVQKTIAVYL